MQTTLEYLENFETLKKELVDNLNVKEVSAEYTEGFNTLIPKVLSIDTSKKYYAEKRLYEPSQSILFEDIPFEPKVIMFACVSKASEIGEYIPIVEGKDSYCQYAYYFSDGDFFENSTIGGFMYSAFVKKVNPISITLNNSISHTKEYDSESGKYKITLIRNDTSSIAFRFAGSQSGIPYQIVVFG